MGINFGELKQRNDIVDVVEPYVKLAKNGSEYVGLCPFHEEKTPSLQVNPRKQIFKCFGCGKGGDVFDFLMAYGKTLPEAVAILEGNAALIPDFEKKKARQKQSRVDWKPLQPQHPASVFTHYRHGEPSRTWAYRNPDGSILGYVCRFDLADGKKEVLPYSYCTDGNRYEWRWQGLDVPRPLYNLHLLAQFPDKTVIIVEGEKCADAVNEQMDKAIAVCWIGGSKGIKNADWQPLLGRKIIYWADNHTQDRYGEKHPKAGELKPFHEQDGNAAMLAIDAILKDHCSTRKWLNVPAEMPHKWDAADKEWQPGEMKKFIRESLIEVPPIPMAEPEPMPELPPSPPPMEEHEGKSEFPIYHADQSPPPPPPNMEEDENELSQHNPYFKFLGYFNDSGRPTHCFYPLGNKLIVKLNTSQMTVSSLMDLAPLAYWEHNFPNKGKAKFDVDAATNWLSATSQAAGIFSSKRARGRGAWFDDGRTVLHAGSHLVVDGQQLPLGKLTTNYIYEVGEPLGFPERKPLPASEASKLLEVTKLVNWEREVNAYLLAGWCVIAPICGALKWRPHIWITGAASSGKSWVFKEIIRRLLGDTAFAVQGETTESGLRQWLGHDALPVVFDEAEAEDKRSQERIQTVLNLMRAASSDDGGKMAKGSAAGNAVTYSIRSCFAFASIGVSLSQQSDRSRVTILGVKKLKDDDPVRIERWDKLQKLHNDLITDDYVERMQARTLTMVPIIIKNAATFANAAKNVIGAQRAGDQLGAILAGAYSLFSSKLITYEEAVMWVKDKDWNEEKGLESTRDEYVLFSYLMEQITRVEANGTGYERTIGELILAASLDKQDEYIGNETAQNRLRRLGFKIDSTGFMYISNRSASISKMLNGTPWEKNHSRTLMRIEGSVSIESTTFAAGIKGRAVALPIRLLTGKP